MEPKDFYRQNIAFMKYMSELTMNTWAAMFEYDEKMLEFASGQGGAGNDESKKYLKEWLENGRKAREEFRKNMDSSFDRMKEFYE